MQSNWEDDEEIKIFREYLRIPSVQPNVDYEPCVEFLKKQANNLNLPISIHYPSHVKKPVVIITWTGTQPALPSIILNSHMDVVPVFPDKWLYPPFAAQMDDDGRIYARGSQDMKCVGMQYLAAIRSLKNTGIILKRTIHVMFVPDEEIGGFDGMQAFVRTTEFKALNVGFALDEGLPSPTDVYTVSYGERIIWHIIFKCTGRSGHGSLLLENTPGVKVHYLIDKLTKLRQESIQKLENNPNLTPGDVTSINLTIMDGGIQNNVIPPEFNINFDIRISVDTDLVAFEKMIRNWCTEAGDGIELIFEQKEYFIEPTKTDDSNPYWLAFAGALTDLKLKYQKQILTGGTDCRFIRAVGIPAIGFSPIANTPVLMHDHNEFLKADTYLKGIEIYKKILLRLGNGLSADATDDE